MGICKWLCRDEKIIPYISFGKEQHNQPLEDRFQEVQALPEDATDVEKMKYYFDVIPPKGMEGKITISKPNKPFTVTPGFKKKKIVILRTTEVLANDDRKDTIIPIKIKAYAFDKDGKKSEKIVVLRNSTFVFPRADILHSAK